MLAIGSQFVCARRWLPVDSVLALLDEIMLAPKGLARARERALMIMLARGARVDEVDLMMLAELAPRQNSLCSQETQETGRHLLAAARGYSLRSEEQRRSLAGARQRHLLADARGYSLRSEEEERRQSLAGESPSET